MIQVSYTAIKAYFSYMCKKKNAQWHRVLPKPIKELIQISVDLLKSYLKLY